MRDREIEFLKNKASELRKAVVTMAHKSGSSHVASALSMMDILTVLYFKILNIAPETAKSPLRDKFILSKGHGASGLYAVLAERGFFDKGILDSYCRDGSALSGHPKKDSLPGIECSTGSLGHGLSMGCGIALGDKHSNINARTVVLMGDGECNEGSVWESAMFAAQKRLNNLIAVIDNNKLQGLGKVDEITALEPIGEKWKAFGWNVIEIDGHNVSEIYDALITAYGSLDFPTAIIARTIKGRGVSFMENRLEWHYRSTNEEQFQRALKELD
ncbi:transketolase [Fonticella tunisiensis]|uniref:Transketolase subunit A n=1 Tax=Fonticella tunisiensis TaxID=1096341 RepID=A0A4R7KT37_9CLOT|nr:transketolase [Fonticella tunisiensis]TDT61028.1 transketolase subunit A [Fonticella tunisiensis]